MTIRSRMTVWYAGILLVSILLIAGFSFIELRNRQREAQKEAAEQNKMNRENSMDWEEPAEPDGGVNWKDVVDLALWIGVPGVLLSIGGGWWLMRKALAPVTILMQKAEQINDRNLHEKLVCSGNGDELDRLTDVFNTMTARLDGSFQNMREFTLHASHELKTPLTILHGEIETALAEGPLTQIQSERLERLLDEVQRLAKIVDGLTLLTRARADQIALENEPFPLDEMVRDVFADTQILAKSSEIQVQLTICESIMICGDRHRLRQTLLNLVDNAVKYNVPNGLVTFSLARAQRCAELIISNTGPGISSAHLARVFDPFFRADASRNRTVDGCGLGLSIAKWIVSAHGGTIKINSNPRQITTVTLQLPMAPECKAA